LKFGYQQPSHTFEDSKNIFSSLQKIAVECEVLNYDSFWIMDHLTQIDFVGRRDDPIMEAYTTLAALSTSTEKIKLGALCTCNFFRNPALLAKMGATIDQISRGRFILGLGAGWFAEEARMYGYKYETDEKRLAMLEESVQIIQKAWTGERPTFKGSYYNIDDLVLSPKPVQIPRPKILIGGGGERVTLNLVAKYADACNLFPNGEELRHKLDVLRDHCDKVGRDYTKILKTKLASIMFAQDRDSAIEKIMPFKPSWLDPVSYADTFLLGSPSEISKQVSELADIGIEYLIVNFRGRYDPKDKLTFAREVMKSF
jgi:F420-dependent oxidoreductase-like protein